MMGQSQSTIQMAPRIRFSGDQVVDAKKDADKTNPTVPAKTKVDNPKKLTDDEKKEVAGKVTEANKDKFPEKTEVTVADDGTVTIKLSRWLPGYDFW